MDTARGRRRVSETWTGLVDECRGRGVARAVDDPAPDRPRTGEAATIRHEREVATVRHVDADAAGGRERKTRVLRRDQVLAEQKLDQTTGGHEANQGRRHRGKG